jgi:inosine/xanthosine triphosphatase
MKIAVGTKSKLKLRAVENSLQVLGVVGEVVGYKVKSLISDQPQGFEETSEGALNRATEALYQAKDSKIGVGIENGLFNIPGINEWFDMPIICVLTDDSKKYFSVGAGYSIPSWMIERIFSDHTELGFIIQELDKDAEKDPINYFTKGALKREEILTQAIVCALNNAINKERYLE